MTEVASAWAPGAAPLLRLSDARAADPAVAGAKAANLARAAAAGLPVLPGFVVTTRSGATAAGLPSELEEALDRAWAELVRGHPRPVIVRSSSTVEDIGTSSMAGQFHSVLGVDGRAALLSAVREVLASAERPHDPALVSRPMGVLVQPELDARVGGVLFGVDPVTGDDRRLVVEAVPGGPVAVVEGAVTAARLLLARSGRLIEATGADARTLLPWRQRRQLAGLARRAEVTFGGPQDIEWAYDGSGRLWLLQSRPVTATGGAAAGGPLLGPGPVAETFPEPLRRLEVDLWIAPLRAGVIGALGATGAVSRRRIARSPVITTVGGWAAADLALIGPDTGGGLRRIAPWRAARRLSTAWRVGRLRAALPGLATELLEVADADLLAVPSLDRLDDPQLAVLLRRAHQELVALHGLEVLSGMLAPDTGQEPSLAAVALGALAAGRAEALSDSEIVARHPVTLALLPPALGRELVLPAAPCGPSKPGGLSSLGHREALRLRARWVQELTAAAASELGRRLTSAGRLPDAALVGEMTLEELLASVAGEPVPGDLAVRRAVPSGPPLPGSFKLDAKSAPVDARTASRDGRPAGGGRRSGRVTAPGMAPAPGEVLVVATLDPRLAAALPGLAGLVCETGSSLSHLAILARELHVPTVVGVAGARSRFPAGSLVVVDGRTGEVSLLEGPDARGGGGGP
jgi:rifampicin phosphotransferase